ncbi:MAG: hypothetical protein WC637_00085 [Victivallales bacterium]
MPKEPTENISVTMPINLLQILDHFCCECDLNRSQAIARAVRLYVGTKIAKTPAFWDREYHRLQEEGKI